MPRKHTRRIRLLDGVGEMRSAGSPPSTAMSTALNARALFRFKVSVVEMGIRLVEDPK
jgi:hypothetical protein